MSISEYFPKTHKRAGEPTNFVMQISNVFYGSFPAKLHTMRQNYSLWKKRIDEVIAGDAILVLFSWSGKPYNSSHHNRFVFGKNTEEIRRFVYEYYKPHSIDTDCQIILKDNVEIGVQRFELIPDKDGAVSLEWHKIDNHIRKEVEWQFIANNDGLSSDNWREWFKNYDLTKPMAIIQLTKFRY